VSRDVAVVEVSSEVGLFAAKKNEKADGENDVHIVLMACSSK
jgi:hypothetical protein